MTSAAPDPDKSAETLAALRGHAHFSAELAREVLAKAGLAGLPEIQGRDRFIARLCQAVIADPKGAKQILVIGGGYTMPSANPHEIAQEIDAGAKCVYVDDDEVVSIYTNRRLYGSGVNALYAGGLTTHQMLSAVWMTLNVLKAVLVIYITDLVPTNEAVRTLRELRGLLPPQSEMVVVNSGEALDAFALAWNGNARLQRRWYPRRAAELRALVEESSNVVMAPGIQDCFRFRGGPAYLPTPTGFLFARMRSGH